MEYCLSDWRMWAVSSIPTRTREIASIYDPAKLQIWVDVNQRDVARLYVGQPVEVTLDAESGQGLYRGGFANSASRIALEEYDPGKNPSQ